MGLTLRKLVPGSTIKVTNADGSFWQEYLLTKPMDFIISESGAEVTEVVIKPCVSFDLMQDVTDHIRGKIKA
jgi:hypothetical protein